MAEEIKKPKVFISWHNSSVNNSKEVAREFELFFKALFEQDVEIFCSADMKPGKWRVNLDKSFVECTHAVFILQGDAVNANWINAEYGAFAMKSLLCKDDSCARLIAFKFPDDRKTVSESKAPIKDLQTYEFSLTPEQAVLIYFGRLLYELENGVSALPLSNNDDYITLLKERKCDIFDRYWKIFAKNIALFKQYGKGYENQREEYIVASDAEVGNVVADSFELPNLFFDAPSQEGYVHRDIVECIKTRLDSNQFVNLVGMGGCGKTTITYNFVNSYRDCYSLCTGKVINGNFYAEFNEYFANKFNIPYKNNQDEKYNEQIFRQILSVLKKYKRTEERKYNLFVLDINEDSRYDQISESISALKQLEDWRFLVVSREKIEVLKGNQIDLCKIAQSEQDFDFLKNVLFHYLKVRKCFYERHFDDEKLGNLFKKFGYLPLLVEQLAYYLDSDEFSTPKTYDDLMELLGDDVLHSDLADIESSKLKYQIVGKFLSKLMDFHKRLSSDQKNIAKYLMLWPAENYSPDFIKKMSGFEFGKNFTKELGNLCDKCVLDRISDDNTGCFSYKMHGLIASSFRDQVFTKEANKEFRDFTVYTDHLNRILESDFDETTMNCVKFSLSHFASFDVKYLLDMTSIISDKHRNFWLSGSKFDPDKAFNPGTTPICENALKIKVLRLENPEISQVDVYKKIVGELKDDGHKTNPMPSVDEYYYSCHKSTSDLPMEQTDEYGKYVCVTVKGVTFKMRKVFGDTYQMGSQIDDDNKPHKETVGDFYMCETQVSQKLWDAVMKESGFPNPSNFTESDLNPVECISWYDCLNFIMELNEQTGLQFRLPTEAEWEYAAGWRKDGGRNTYSGCNDERDLSKYAWFEENSMNKIHPVATNVYPNELGIYDMSGNVWEWCQDLYDSSGASRVLRGGSWSSDTDSCRVSYRGSFAPNSRDDYSGFRLLLSSPKKEKEEK